MKQSPYAELAPGALGVESMQIQGPRFSSELLTAECIRLLRDRVESSEADSGVSDTTIGAVATLAAVEVFH
jgi:hypothetical protein